jgi:hypothetical protein
MSNVKLRQILLLFAAGAVAASSTAAAATLGGTTTSNLGAGSDQVPRCDNSVNIEYDVDQRFDVDGTTVISEVTAVTISGINTGAGGCDGGLMRIVVARANDSIVFDDTRTVDSSSETFSISATGVGQVSRTLVVIEGGN